MSEDDKIVKRIVRNYSFIKGHLAEALVEHLFSRTLQIETIRTGYEFTNQRLSDLKRLGKIKKGDLKKLSATPDFKIVRKDKEYFRVFDIEVKYRSKGCIKYKDIKKYDDDDILFVFLDDDHFYCMKNKTLKSYFEKNETLYFSSKICPLLKDFRLFKFTDKEQDIIYTFSAYIPAFMQNIPTPNDLKKQIEGRYDERSKARKNGLLKSAIRKHMTNSFNKAVQNIEDKEEANDE